MELLNCDIEAYLNDFLGDEDPVLRELTRETYLKTVHPRMISGYYQAAFLQMITQMIRPEKVLEIGTFTGYSAICIARGLNENAMLFTVEVNDEYETISKKYIEKAGLQHKIVQLFGDALHLVPSLPHVWDMVFIDAEKSQYPAYLNMIHSLLKPGGYLLADNVLWDGKVIDSAVTDKMTAGIRQFNAMMQNNSQYSKIILPLRDGLMLARKN